MLPAIKHNLISLGFKENEIKAYVALTQLGEATASHVAKKTGMPRTTVIGILDKLKDEGFVTIHRTKGLNYYWAEQPENLVGVLEQKIEAAKDLNKLLGNLYRSEPNFPLVQVFDKKESIKNFIEKTVSNLEKKSIIFTIDSPTSENYSKVSIDTANPALKRKREIFTRTLIPHGAFQAIEKEKIKNNPIEIREMPEGIDFQASLWILKDMVVHFSGNPPFIVAIKHNAITAGMKSIFDFLWSMSTPKEL